MTEILIVLGIILGLVLTGVLNRLRGTGLIKHFGTLRIQEHEFKIYKYKLKVPEMSIEIKLVWNHIYGLYFALIFGYLTGSIGIGVAALVAYLVGESKGWGEWVGALTRWEPKNEAWLIRQYEDDEGKKFPFIHQIANYFIKEKGFGSLDDRLKQYTKYATLALTLRGIYWFLPMTLIAIFTGLISWYFGLLSLVLIGVSFPLACYLGKLIKFKKSFKFLHFSRGWENQEFVYGIFHFIFFILPLILL
jgi:hypothetical protein